MMKFMSMINANIINARANHVNVVAHIVMLIKLHTQSIGYNKPSFHQYSLI